MRLYTVLLLPLTWLCISLLPNSVLLVHQQAHWSQNRQNRLATYYKKTANKRLVNKELTCLKPLRTHGDHVRCHHG